MLPQLGHIALLLAFGTALRAEPVPHPTLPDRLVERRGSHSVEFDADQPELAAPGLDALAALHERLADQRNRLAALPPSPLSAGDLDARKDEILRAIADQIGLDAPTALQAETYDTFLDYYKLVDRHMKLLAEDMLQVAPKRLLIWKGKDLFARVEAGQEVPNFIFDPETGEGNFHYSTPSTHDRLREIAAIRQAMEKRRLAHSLAIVGDKVSASLSLGESAAPRTPSAPGPRNKKREANAPSESNSPPQETFFPLVLRENDSALEKIRSLPEFASSLAQAAESALAYRHPAFVHVILHETIEVGVVEKYIRSPDRRWICDGAANYLAWQLSCEFADPDFARSVYDLDAQLEKYRDLQSEIDLWKWAAEAEDEDEDAHADARLGKAHYAYATRAVAYLVESIEPHSFADFCRLVSKTPLEKTNARTLKQSFRNLSGKRLGPLVKRAINDPIDVHP